MLNSRNYCYERSTERASYHRAAGCEDTSGRYILDWVSPLFSNVTYRDGNATICFISTYAYRSLDRLLLVDFPKDTSYFVIAERGTLIGGILWEGTRFDGRKLISYDDWLDVLKCRGVLSIEEFTSHKVTMRNILE